MFLRSRLTNVFFWKVLAPLACGLPALSVIGSDFLSARLFVVAPFLVVAFFMSGLAILEVRDGAVRYFRLFKWTTIRQDEVFDVKVVWKPFIASIRLKKYLFPWGRLYFLLDANSNPNPFGEGRFPLIEYLTGKTISTGQTATDLNLLKLKSITAAAAGFVLGCLNKFLFPSPNSSVLHDSTHITYGHSGGLNNFFSQVIDLLGNPAMGLALLVIFGLLAIFRYRRPDAWLYAFCAGCLMFSPFLHLIRALA